MLLEPLLQVSLVLARNLERALLYFFLAVFSGLAISMSCLCGHWAALKLAPVDNYSEPHARPGTSDRLTVTKGRDFAEEQRIWREERFGIEWKRERRGAKSEIEDNFVVRDRGIGARKGRSVLLLCCLSLSGAFVYVIRGRSDNCGPAI